jgi:hypothetical protein
MSVTYAVTVSCDIYVSSCLDWGGTALEIIKNCAGPILIYFIMTTLAIFNRKKFVTYKL